MLYPKSLYSSILICIVRYIFIHIKFPVYTHQDNFVNNKNNHKSRELYTSISEGTRSTMHDNEARNRTMLRRMTADKSVSDDEWFHMHVAVLVQGQDAEYKRLYTLIHV